MSYCQFQNTLLGLRQVMGTTEEFFFAPGEDAVLSHDEQRAMRDLYRVARDFVEKVENGSELEPRDDDGVDRFELADKIKSISENNQGYREEMEAEGEAQEEAYEAKLVEEADAIRKEEADAARRSALEAAKAL